jgi:hypothetical protein
MKKYISILIVLCSLTWLIAFAHPGRTDENGGHWVKTEGWGYEVGTYHYHNDGYQSNHSDSYNSSSTSSISPKIEKNTEPQKIEESEEENTELEEYKKQAKKREAELQKEIERLKKGNKITTIASWIMIAFFGGIPLLGLISGITSSIVDKIKNKQE